MITKVVMSRSFLYERKPKIYKPNMKRNKEGKTFKEVLKELTEKLGGFFPYS